MFLLYEKLENVIMKLFMFIVYLSLVFIPIALSIQVICRYFLNEPIAGIEELATAAFTLLVIFGSAVLFREKKHIAVDVFLRNMSQKNCLISEILSDVLTLIIFIALIYSFYIAVPFQKTHTSLVFKIPNSAYTIAMIISFTVMTIDCIRDLFKSIGGYIKRWKK